MVLSDSLGYQALNARAAKVSSSIPWLVQADEKDALGQRTQILEDSQTATKNAINKRRNVERLKGSSSINPSKVDDALHEMEDVSHSLPISLHHLPIGKQSRGSTLFKTQCNLAKSTRFAPGTFSPSPRRCRSSLTGECKALNRLPPTPSAGARGSPPGPREDWYKCSALYSIHHRSRYTLQTTSSNSASTNGGIEAISIPTSSTSTNTRRKSINVLACPIHSAKTEFDRTTTFAATYDGGIS